MRRRALTALLAAVVLAPGCALVAAGDEEFGRGAETVTDPVEVAHRVIDARELARHVDFLASDPMRGRDTPSEHLDRAAAWIAEQLRAAGFEPAGEDGGFMQLWWPEPASSGADTLAARNVVAVLPGADPALSGEYVIVAAHYDHLGVGEPDEEGDSIYNGADDNASGVAAMLEVARAFGSLPRRPARPLLFLAFSGSEDGQLGAHRFAEDPTVLLSEAVAALNLEMVGRNHPDTVRLVGYGYSSLGALLEETGDTEGLDLVVDPDPVSGDERFTTADSYPFARLGIPALTVTTGRHDDYHRPTDEADRIDPDKAARIARLVFLAAYELASGAGAEWTEEGRRAIR